MKTGLVLILQLLILANSNASEMTVRVYEKKTIKLGDYQDCGFDRSIYFDHLCLEEGHCISNHVPSYSHPDVAFERDHLRFFVADTAKNTISLKFKDQLVEIGTLVPVQKSHVVVRKCESGSEVQNPYTIYRVDLNATSSMSAVERTTSTKKIRGVDDLGRRTRQKVPFATMETTIKTAIGQFEIVAGNRIYRPDDVGSYVIESNKLNGKSDGVVGYTEFYF